MGLVGASHACTENELNEIHCMRVRENTRASSSPGASLGGYLQGFGPSIGFEVRRATSASFSRKTSLSSRGAGGEVPALASTAPTPTLEPHPYPHRLPNPNQPR